MRYHVLVQGEHYEVDVERAGGGWRLSMPAADGEGTEVHQADVGTLDDGHAYSLIIDRRSIDIGVEEHGSRLDLLIGGGRYPVEVLGEREWLARSIQGDALEGERSVTANMTGIVRDVLVAPGDAVTAGQTLFILEAMKMENEVKAQVDGTVTRVAVEPGVTVSIGDLVLEIE